MRCVARLSGLTLIIATPLLAGGCVDQAKYDQMLMSHRSLEEQLVRTEEERDTAKANLDTIRQQLTRSTTELNGLKSKYGMLEGDLDKMYGEYDKLGNRVKGLDFGPLPENLSAALQDLAAAHPELLSFDPRRGMLRFASDFTFPLGSTELSSTASSSLSQLAKILNSPTAANFEVRVIGHTDNVPISKPETRQKHATNVHLSVHRAIAVRETLVSSGVEPVRVQVAGYGEFRPSVMNPAKGGAPENRRVEIFLTPMPDWSAPTAASRTVSAPTIGSEPMK